MAIDTEDKRRSVQAMTFVLMRPVPDGGINDRDRATVAWLYLTDAAVAAVGGHGRIGFVPIWLRGTN